MRFAPGLPNLATVAEMVIFEKNRGKQLKTPWPSGVALMAAAGPQVLRDRVPRHWLRRGANVPKWIALRADTQRNYFTDCLLPSRPAAMRKCLTALGALLHKLLPANGLRQGILRPDRRRSLRCKTCRLWRAPAFSGSSSRMSSKACSAAG